MNGEYIIDSWLDYYFKDEYELGTDGIWYPVDDTTKESEVENEIL